MSKAKIQLVVMAGKIAKQKAEKMLADAGIVLASYALVDGMHVFKKNDETPAHQSVVKLNDDVAVAVETEDDKQFADAPTEDGKPLDFKPGVAMTMEGIQGAVQAAVAAGTPEAAQSLQKAMSAYSDYLAKFIVSVPAEAVTLETHLLKGDDDDAAPAGDDAADDKGAAADDVADDKDKKGDQPSLFERIETMVGTKLAGLKDSVVTEVKGLFEPQIAALQKSAAASERALGRKVSFEVQDTDEATRVVKGDDDVPPLMDTARDRRTRQMKSDGERSATGRMF